MIKTLLLFKWPIRFCSFPLCFSLWNNTSINKDKAFQPYIAFSEDEWPQVVINNQERTNIDSTQAFALLPSLSPKGHLLQEAPLTKFIFFPPGSYPPLLSEATRGAGGMCVSGAASGSWPLQTKTTLIFRVEQSWRIGCWSDINYDINLMVILPW